MIKKEIDNKLVTIFYSEIENSDKLPVIILNTYDENGQDIWNKTRELTNKNFILVTISNIDWNRDMSPWYMEKLFKGEKDYLGEADKYLLTLTERIIPEVEETLKEINIKVDKYTLGGYSLAGLFALYSIYKTDIFSNIISCSGSLWYPYFDSFIESNSKKKIPEKIYFSLGNKESKTKNKMMASVEEKTKYIKEYFDSINIKTIYEENEGNHFQDVTLRISKGIKWILE